MVQHFYSLIRLKLSKTGEIRKLIALSMFAVTTYNECQRNMFCSFHEDKIVFPYTWGCEWCFCWDYKIQANTFNEITGTSPHLTMITPTPYASGLPGTIFSCFRSSRDTGVELSFGRPFPLNIPGSTIETATSLPDGTVTLDNGQAVTHYLPPNVNATGLFYCQGSSGGVTTRVYSILHSFYSKSFPK